MNTKKKFDLILDYSILNLTKIDNEYLNIKNLKLIFDTLIQNRLFTLIFHIIDKKKFESLKDKKLLNELSINNNIYHLNFIYHYDALNKIINAFDKEDINYVLLKGSALRIDVYKNPYERYTRDIDILVSPSDIKKAYIVCRKIGFKYFEKQCSDSANGTLKYSRHLPKMVNTNKIVLEIHHRVTSPSHSQNCILSQSILKNKIKHKYDNKDFYIPRAEEMYIHLIYHCVSQEKKTNGFMLLNDLRNLKNKYELNEDLIIDLYKKSFLNKYIQFGEKKINLSRNLTNISNEFNMKKDINLIRRYLSKLTNLRSQLSFELQIDEADIKYNELLKFLVIKFLKKI